MLINGIRDAGLFTNFVVALYGVVVGAEDDINNERTTWRHPRASPYGKNITIPEKSQRRMLS